MGRQASCSCARCRCRGALFPAALITLGLLLLVGQYGPYTIVQLWPILLIVIGALEVTEGLVSSEGHIGS